MCTSTEQGEYRFTCPVCDAVVVKAAEQRTIDLLVAAGVEMTTWSLPREMFEPRSGEPISHDDLIDFHALLADDDALHTALGLLETD